MTTLGAQVLYCHDPPPKSERTSRRGKQAHGSVSIGAILLQALEPSHIILSVRIRINKVQYKVYGPSPPHMCPYYCITMTVKSPPNLSSFKIPTMLCYVAVIESIVFEAYYALV
jgi:hypothetical protein